MARAGVVVAVTAMLIGSTGAGILAGAVLVVGGFWAYSTLGAPDASPKFADPPAIAVAVAEEPLEAPVAVATPVTAPHATPTSVTTTPRPATTRSSTTRTTASTATSTATRAPKPAPAPAAAPSGDLLADEDEWEAMGFEEAPDVAPGTPDAEEPVDDEELDAILEDLDADPEPMRRGR